MNATDGDTKTNILHKELQDYLDLNKSDFDERVEKLKDFPKALPVSDLLHLLKSMRRKILRHKIMMTKTSPCIDFNKEREILRMSKYYHEIVESTNPLETMKDNLALMIINTENLLLFGQNEHYQFFTLLFVEVLILTVIQAKKLSIECRIDLCRICYNCITNLQNNCFKKQRSSKKSANFVSFLDNNTYQRMRNNLLCYAYAFKHYGRELSTDALSSHPLELTFGDIRRGSNGNDTSEMAIHSVAKSFIRDDLMNQFGKNVSPTRGRSYIAGSSYKDGWSINLPNDIDACSIQDEIIQIANGKLSFEQFKSTNTWKLSIFLKDNADTIVPNLYGNNSRSKNH